MRYLLIDDYDSRENGNVGAQLFDTLAECQVAIAERAEEYSEDDYYFRKWEEGLSLYLVDLEIPIVIETSKPIVTIGTPTEIPAPLPGESVTDYARRITGG